MSDSGLHPSPRHTRLSSFPACAFSHYTTERLTNPYSGGPIRIRRIPSQQATIARLPQPIIFHFNPLAGISGQPLLPGFSAKILLKKYFHHPVFLADVRSIIISVIVRPSVSILSIWPSWGIVLWPVSAEDPPPGRLSPGKPSSAGTNPPGQEPRVCG